MKSNCLRCNTALSDDFQLIFDETGIELQLDQLLSELFDISVVKDLSTEQALCHECVCTLIELYDAKKYEEEKLIIEEDIQPEKEASEKCDSEDKEEMSYVKEEIIEENINAESPSQMIEELDQKTDHEEYEEIIEESSSMDDEEFLGFAQTPGTEDLLDELNFRDYLKNVINSDLSRINFDQDSACRLCGAELNSHIELLSHVEECHQTESKQYACVFCELECFDSIEVLASHIVLKHYDLNSIEIYCMCPECNKTFSSFLEYNKHSCYKKSLSDRLQQECQQCTMKFISNKRYRFHLQFHLSNHRPKACFICDILFPDENDFFEHIMFAHEKKDSSFVCKKCDRVCTTKQLYESHMKLHNAKKLFQCQYCPKSYLYNQMLTNHIQQHHSYENPNVCAICKKSLTNSYLLKRHMQVVHKQDTESDLFVCSACGQVGACEDDIMMLHLGDEKCLGAEATIESLNIAYACEFCEMAFKSVQQLKEHRTTTHSDNRYRCWICTSSYGEYKNLKTHILTHTNWEPLDKTFPINRHYVCNFESCEQSYLSWPSLRGHQLRHARKFKCEYCSQTFTTEAKYMRHLKSHDNNAEYPCQFCPKLCLTQMSLSVHVARKHNNNYKTCDVCQTTCTSEQALKDHIKHLHIEATCETCGKTMKNYRNLQVHIQMIHSQVKRFFCSVCDRGYFNKSDLKVHERAAHQEENKFKCSHCNFTSGYEASFQAHVLKHSQHKPFKCAECSREFTRKMCFKLHMLRHSDNKPFACPVEHCGRSFVMPGILNSHIKIAHPECGLSVKHKRSSVAKRKKPNPTSEEQEMAFVNSPDYVVVREVGSGDEYIQMDDEDGDIVVFDGSNGDDEEIVLECAQEA